MNERPNDGAKAGPADDAQANDTRAEYEAPDIDTAPQELMRTLTGTAPACVSSPSGDPFGCGVTN